jgi:hypothetical protein
MANQVWLNEYGIGHVMAAARRTGVDQPFLMLPLPGDQDFANRAALNILSERFAQTFLTASLGRPVTTASYIFGISCEKYGEIRTLKIRVLVIAEQTLIDLFGPENRATALNVPSTLLRARLKTLQIMYDVYQKDKSAAHPILGQLELGVPA